MQVLNFDLSVSLQITCMMKPQTDMFGSCIPVRALDEGNCGHVVLPDESIRIGHCRLIAIRSKVQDSELTLVRDLFE